MTIDGGTYNQSEKGNLIVSSTTATDEKGEKGGLLELKSGTLDTHWLSLGQSGVADGTCTFNMTGGSLKIGSGAQDFRIGLGYHAVANIYGGDITVNGRVLLANSSNGGELNIDGADSTWNVALLDWKANGTANFIGEALTIASDGTMNPLLSTIHVTGSVNIASKIGVDISSSYYSGAGFLETLPTQNLLEVGGNLNWSPSSVEVLGDWIVSANSAEKTVELTLNENAITSIEIENGRGILENVENRGWAKITGTAEEAYTLQVAYDGELNGDWLAEWLEQQLPESQKSISVSFDEGFLVFDNLQMNSNGTAYFSYNFNALTSHDVPEPTTWGLLLSGMLFFLLQRRVQGK